MNTQTLHTLINLRGAREQANKFAFGFKGGMKGCHTKGCKVFTPLQHSLKGIDLSEALILDKKHEGEIPVNE